VVSDTIGAGVFSGVGGQVDFIRAAGLSEGGKPIIALPSQTSKGKPRIVYGNAFYAPQTRFTRPMSRRQCMESLSCARERERERWIERGVCRCRVGSAWNRSCV
jgi:hypothetical protein